MKNLIRTFTILFIVLTSCQPDAPDANQAAKFVENYIMKTGNADYKDLSGYYSEEMNNGESDEARIEKLNRLHDVLGDVKSFKLIESKVQSSTDEDPSIKLIYSVEHSRMTVTETYTVKKEGGGLKISSQNVENTVTK